jgi:hypothetical protein
MAFTIFYSWQSDLPNNTNRGFIEKALRGAIKRVGEDMDVEKAPRDNEIRLDKDTDGIPGSPPIADVIFKKIDNCDVFVPDVTFVCNSEFGRPIPNPNVLVEYGWALKTVKHERIISVINTFYGEPTQESLPFHMRHLRHPIKYRLHDGADSEERERVKETLEKDLTRSLKLILGLGRKAKSAPTLSETPYTSNPSTFLLPDETFGVIEDRWGEEGQLHLPETQRAFLRLIPTREVPVIASAKVALEMVRDGGLAPLTNRLEGWMSTGRNRYGAFICNREKNIVLQLTELFKNRELWGIDAHLLDKREFTTSFGFFRFVPFESTFKASLKNYLTFAANALNLPLPLRLIAGVTDVEGYRMTAPPGLEFDRGFTKYKGSVVEQHIVHEGIIDDYEADVAKILRPFFEKVWEECGLERPDVN